jgi:deazaflavin-dependent oxidoreductase (nitroreductase family)
MIGGMAFDQIPDLPGRAWARGHAETILEAGTTEPILVEGKPVVLVTIRSARTGRPGYVPLMRVERDGSYCLVASFAGAPKHPTWYHGVVAHPDVTIQDGTQVAAYVARQVEGDERAAWWERAVAAYPSFADYQEKTEREIPVLVCEPA